jgi:hypothetical protein
MIQGDAGLQAAADYEAATGRRAAGEDLGSVLCEFVRAEIARQLKELREDA